MKKSEFKALIRESVREVLSEGSSFKMKKVSSGYAVQGKYDPGAAIVFKSLSTAKKAMSDEDFELYMTMNMDDDVAWGADQKTVQKDMLENHIDKSIVKDVVESLSVEDLSDFGSL